MATKKTVKQLKKAQKAGKEAGMTAYLNFLLSGQVESKEEAKLVNSTAKRPVTASEATVIAKIVLAALDQKLTQVMDVIQIQNKVLQKLEATDEMFAEAEKEYNEQLAAMQKELEERSKTSQDTEEAEEELPEGEVTEGELEALKEALEENDAQ